MRGVLGHFFQVMLIQTAQMWFFSMLEEYVCIYFICIDFCSNAVSLEPGASPTLRPWMQQTPVFFGSTRLDSAGFGSAHRHNDLHFNACLSPPQIAASTHKLRINTWSLSECYLSINAFTFRQPALELPLFLQYPSFSFASLLPPLLIRHVRFGGRIPPVFRLKRRDLNLFSALFHRRIHRK